MKLSMTCTEMTTLREKAPVIFRGDLETCFSQISSLGYEGAEVHIHDSAQIDRKKLKQLLRQYHLDLTSIGTGSAYGRDHLSLTSPDQAVRQQAVQRMKDHILTAADYDHAVVIIGLIRGKVAECASQEEYEARLVESLKECADYAGNYGAVLGMELINHYECDYANTIEEGLALLGKVASPALQLHIDTYHMNIEEQNIHDAIIKGGDKICHVHVADNDRWYAGHAHYDFGDTIRALKEIGYSHAVAAETLYYPDPVTSARNTYQEIKQWI